MRSPNPRPPVSGPAGTRQMQGDLTEPARHNRPRQPGRPAAAATRRRRSRARGARPQPQARTGETTRTSRPAPPRAGCPRRKTGAAGTTPSRGETRPATGKPPGHQPAAGPRRHAYPCHAPASHGKQPPPPPPRRTLGAKARPAPKPGAERRNPRPGRQRRPAESGQSQERLEFKTDKNPRQARDSPGAVTDAIFE
jgi:hypothetical protein